jgi:hypothetical protein
MSPECLEFDRSSPSIAVTILLREEPDEEDDEEEDDHKEEENDDEDDEGEGYSERAYLWVKNEAWTVRQGGR